VIMGETPNIVMQCPKCGKRFPFDQVYCEKCTAMLEPFETEQEGPAPSTEDFKGDADEQPAVTDEKIEDIKIDHLRVDIENKFVYTLLLEIDQLKRRLAKKEKYLAGIQEKEGPGHPERIADTGKAEAAIDEIMKKITKREMTLDNLEHKLTDDISTLDTELGKLHKPALFGLMNERGHYFRMRSSELKTKKLILDVIQGKKSPAALRLMDILRPIILVPAVAAITIISALLMYTYAPNVPPGLLTVSRSKTPAGNPAMISERDINSLLDDIRTANLKKDLALWKSRYSRGYLASREKKENIVEQWEKVDYKSLAYKVEDLQTGPAHASATVIWEMDFSPRKSTAIKKITQRLRADFAIEDGRLKITSVVKEESY
jgi:hypothetical protein